MRELASKTLVVGEHSVTLDATVEAAADGYQVVRLRASTGGTLYTATFSMHPNLSRPQAEAQAELDRFRQQVAEECAAREATRVSGQALV